MQRFEYQLSLITVVLGLGVTDLLNSLHQLLRRRTQVEWSVLPLVWAALTFMLVVQIWWAFFWVGDAEAWADFFPFLLYLLNFVLLYLMCAAALPDAAVDFPINLEQFYLGQRRYFFGLFVFLLLLSPVNELLVTGSFDWSWVQLVRLLMVGLGAVLMVSGRRIVHYVVTAAVILIQATTLIMFAGSRVMR